MQAGYLDRSERAFVLWDTVEAFDEISAAAGGLGRFPGREVMPLLQQFTGRCPAPS